MHYCDCMPTVVYCEFACRWTALTLFLSQVDSGLCDVFAILLGIVEISCWVLECLIFSCFFLKFLIPHPPPLPKKDSVIYKNRGIMRYILFKRHSDRWQWCRFCWNISESRGVVTEIYNLNDKLEIITQGWKWRKKEACVLNMKIKYYPFDMDNLER